MTRSLPFIKIAFLLWPLLVFSCKPVTQNNQTPVTPPLDPEIIPVTPTISPFLTLPLEFHFPSSDSEGYWPYTFGVPFKGGQVSSTDPLYVLIQMPDGNYYETDYEITQKQHFGDKSIRWLLFHALLPLPKQESAQSQTGTLYLYKNPPTGTAPSPQLTVSETSDKITVQSNTFQLAVSKTRGTLIDSVIIDSDNNSQLTSEDLQFAAPQSFDQNSIKQFGTYWIGKNQPGQASGIFTSVMAKPDSVVKEFQGNHHVILRIEGPFARFDNPSLLSGRYVVRMTITTAPLLRLNHTWINTEETWKYLPKDNLTSCNTANPNNEDYKTNCLTAQNPSFSLTDLVMAIPQLSQHSSTLNWSVGLAQGNEVTGSGTSAVIFKQIDANNYSQGDQIKSGKLSGTLTVQKDGFSISAGVEDFWANYPQGLEAATDALRLHFWTATTDRHNRNNPTVENAHQLWFIHEGSDLSFQVPSKISEFFYDYVSNETIRMIPEMATAKGISKSHQFIVAFGESAAAITKAQGQELPPVLLSDKEWMTNSGAFGKLSSSSQSFQEFENFIEKITESYLTVPEKIISSGDYGAFNLGDYHSYWWGCGEDYDPTLCDHWFLNRMWLGFHHGYGRIPWIYLARSGNPDFLKWGLRNIRHLTDIDVAHDSHLNADGTLMSPSQQETIYDEQYSVQKYKGGLNDYKGFVHWNAGNRGPDYNLMLTPILQAYYLTGEKRFKDVVGEMLDHFFINDPNAGKWNDNRTVDASLDTLMSAYEMIDPDQATSTEKEWVTQIRTQLATKLPWFIDLMTTRINNMKNPTWCAGFSGCPDIPVDANSSYTVPELSNWAPWLIHFMELKEQGALLFEESIGANEEEAYNKAKDLMVLWADAALERRDSWDGNASALDILAKAYELTGYEKYLKFGLRVIYPIVSTVSQADPNFYQEIAQDAGSHFKTGLNSTDFPEAYSRSATQWADRVYGLFNNFPVLFSRSSINWSYFLQQAPFLIAQATQAGLTLDEGYDSTFPHRIKAGTYDQLSLKAYIKTSREATQIRLFCYNGVDSTGIPYNPPIVNLYKYLNSSHSFAGVATLNWTTHRDPQCSYSLEWYRCPLVYSLSTSSEYALSVQEDELNDFKMTCYLPVSTANQEVYGKSVLDEIGEGLVEPMSSLYFSWKGSENDDGADNYGDLRVSANAPMTMFSLTSPSNQTTFYPGFFFKPYREPRPEHTDNPLYDALTVPVAEDGVWRLNVGVMGEDAIEVFLRDIEGNFFWISKNRYFTPSGTLP